MPGICYVEQNLFPAYIMLDKTYSRHRLCVTKSIPGICYVGQNHIWDLTEKKSMKQAVFRVNKIISEIK